MNKAKIGIVKIGTDIKEDLHKVIEYCGGLSSIIKSEDKVILKPNLNDFDCVTSPLLVESLITYLLDHDIRNFMIAESTFGNRHITEKHFHSSGYYDLCKKYEIPLVNINGSEEKILPVQNPHVLKEIRVGKEVTQATKIINIPVMKVHYATGVTLGLKNLKGFLTPDEKKNFHAIGLDKAIVDLNNTIPVDLTLIDGIECMETMGPKGGDVFPLGLLVAGKEIAETDYIACKIMGYELEEVRHLLYYIEDNKIDIHSIEVCGEKVEDVARPFKKVELRSIIPENITVSNNNACSACMNALLLSCRFIKTSIKEKICITMGNKSQISSEKDNICNISFGNCSSAADSCTHIKGCPPYPMLLPAVIDKMFNVDADK